MFILSAIVAALAAASFSTLVAGAGLAATLVGGVLSYKGSQQSTQAQKRLAGLQQQQMDLSASRDRRSVARQAIIARETALSNATSQGAGFGASSGLAGGMAGVTGEAARGTLAINQNQSIGTESFAQQKNSFNGQNLASMGNGISNFGGVLLNNQQMFSRVGSYFSGKKGWGG